MKDTTQRSRIIVEPKVFKKSNVRIDVEIKAKKFQNIFKNRFDTIPVLLRLYFRFDSTILVAGRLVATGNTRDY